MFKRIMNMIAQDPPGKVPANRAEPHLSADRSTAPAPTFHGNPIKYKDESYTARLEQENRRLRSSAGLLLGSLAVLASFTVSLFPLKEHTTDLVRFGDPVDRTYIITPGEVSVSDREVITQDRLRDYVINMETMNPVGEQGRDEWLGIFTSPAWYDYHLKLVATTNPQSPRAYFQSQGATRAIYPLSVSMMPGQPGTYQVFYQAVDSRGGVEIKRREFVASMNVSYRSIQAKEKDYRSNPTGITVAEYTSSERQLSGQGGAK